MNVMIFGSITLIGAALYLAARKNVVASAIAAPPSARTTAAPPAQKCQPDPNFHRRFPGAMNINIYKRLICSVSIQLCI
jgi:hypothetical protein